MILVDFDPKLRLRRLTCIQYIGRLVTSCHGHVSAARFKLVREPGELDWAVAVLRHFTV